VFERYTEAAWRVLFFARRSRRRCSDRDDSATLKRTNSGFDKDHRQFRWMDRGRLIIVCGLPGSGKTTLATALECRLQAVRFSPDDWMERLSISLYDEEMRAKIEALQWTVAQRLLSLGAIVIIEWGTWGRSERDALRLGARALGAAVELHYLTAPADVLFDRIQRRGLEQPPITWDALVRWFGSFEPPTREELALFDEPLVANP
jgi:predicted kinase